MTRSVALLLLVSVPAVAADVDAGALPPAVWAQRAELQLADGSWADSECFPSEDGGTDCSGGWLPMPTLLDDGRERVNLRTQNAKLLETPPLFSTGTLAAMVIVAALGVLLGGYLGYELGAFIYGR